MEVYVVCYGFISIWSCACQTRSRCSLSFRFRTTLGELYLEFRDGPKSALFCLVVGRHSAAHLLQHCIALCWSSRRHLHAVALAEMRCLCRLLTCIVEYYCNADICGFIDVQAFRLMFIQEPILACFGNMSLGYSHGPRQCHHNTSLQRNVQASFHLLEECQPIERCTYPSRLLSRGMETLQEQVSSQLIVLKPQHVWMQLGFVFK